MAKVRTEHKEQLLAMGKWAEFVVRRDELKAEGVKSCEANRLAVLEFLGEEAAENPGEARDRKLTSSTTRKQKVADAGISAPVTSRIPVLTNPSVTQDTASAPSPFPDEIPIEQFGGREASGNEIILWVIRHLDVSTVTPAECPDPAAWSYLQQCRSNALFRQNFMLQVGLRVLVKKEGDDDSIDLASTRLDETIGKLLSLRGGAEAACQVHYLKDAGSSPAPATTQGGA